MTVVKSYWEAAEGSKRRAAAFLLLFAAAGLLEGLALASVVPLLSATGLGGDDVPQYNLFGESLDANTLRVLALAAFTTLGVLSAGTKFLAELFAIRVLARVEEHLRQRMTHAVFQMQWAVFQDVRSGHLHKATLAATPQIAVGLLYLLRSIGSGAVASLLAVIALLIAPTLSLLALGFGILLGLGYRYAGRKAERHARAVSERAGTIGVEVSELFNNLKLLRASGNLASAEQRLFEAYRRYADSYYRSQLLTPTTRAIFEGTGVAFVALILALSLMLDGTFTPESVAFLALFYRLTPRLLSCQELLHFARIQKPWYDDWRSQLNHALSAGETAKHGKRATFNRELEAREVSFRFPGSSIHAVAGVSWKLPRSGSIAFVGESGSGKTTLLDLISGLLSPTGGQLLLDQVPFSELDLASWQRQLGLVLQETPLLHATVSENVAWTEDTVDEERVIDALQVAHAWDFVKNLPEGISTVVGERGGKLSGGQRQRIALARAIYRRPQLLILDEVTSALDAESEEAVTKALESIKERMAIVLVAHRPNTLRLADRILLLEHGTVTAAGTYLELRKNSARFRELIQAH